jgi:hypothetical protein
VTEFQIVTAVMNLVTSHEGVTNTSLSPDQVAEEVDTYRGRLIDEQDKVSLFRRPYNGYTQTIPSIKVERDEKKLLYVDIPRLHIKRDQTPAYYYIGGLDDKSAYRVISPSDAENVQHDLHLSKVPLAIYSEGRMYFRNATPNLIKIVAVFEDPSALEVLGHYDSEVTNYPLPQGMIDMLIGKTANSYINSLYRVPVQPNRQSDTPQVQPS